MHLSPLLKLFVNALCSANTLSLSILVPMHEGMLTLCFLRTAFFMMRR